MGTGNAAAPAGEKRGDALLRYLRYRPPCKSLEVKSWGMRGNSVEDFNLQAQHGDH